MKTKILYTFLMFFISTLIMAQNITLTFDNAQITNNGVDDFYEVDVFIASDVDYVQGVGLFYMDYNTAAFGTSVVDGGDPERFDFQHPIGTLLGSQNIGLDNYNQFGEANNTPSTVAVSWQQFWSSGTIGINVTATPALLAHIRMKYPNTAETPDLCFNVAGNLFDDQFYTACGPFPPGLAAADCPTEPGVQLLNYDGSDCSGAILPIGCAVKTWDGVNWSPLGAPDATSNVVIAANYDTATDGGSITACEVTVDAGMTLNIAAGEFLSVVNDITVGANAVLSVANEGSLVQIDDAATVTNNSGTITVLKQTPTMAAKSFMVIGSPMTAETREGVYGSSYIVRNHVTANFIPNPGVEAVSPGINNWADDNGNNWLTHTGLLNPGEAYLVFPQPDGASSGSYAQTYGGVDAILNNGIINFNLGFNTDQNSSPNQLANPYASAIDAEVFFDDPANSGIDVIYFWEHNTALSPGYPGYNVANFSMSDISLYQEGVGGNPAASGGATPTQYVSSGQGFGVKPAAAGTAQFNNAMRVTTPNNTYRNNVNRDRLWINVYNDNYELGSTTLIAFTENTSDAFINSEDVRRLATPVSLYSDLDTEEELAINALGTFETSDAFYLGFSTQVKETLNYRISIHDLDGENMLEATVYLIDSLTGTVNNLSEGDYTFQSGEATYSKRFKVIFENSSLGINESNLDLVSLFPNPTQNVVTIVSPKTIVTSATVYDIRGRKVMTETFSTSGNVQIDFSELNGAIYFVEINTEAGKITKRVVKE